MTNTSNVALYLRVSTEDQTTANQLPELQRFVATRGWNVVATFTDEGISGSKASRPGLDQLRAEAAQGKFSAVLVWKFDRIARNTRNLLTLHEELSKVGVALVSVTEGIDTTNAAGKFTMTIMGATAELERANIIERVKAGMRRAQAEGKRVSRPRNVALEGQIQTLKQNGKGVREIARTLGIAASTVSFKLAQIEA